MSQPFSALPSSLPEVIRKDPVLVRFVRLLVVEHGCHTILLYGSRAAGTANAHSDYDLLGIRSVGEPTRDARSIDGAFLDAFIYIEQDLEGAAASMLQVHRGLPLLDPRGTGARLIAEVAEALRSPPPPVPSAELSARRAWCKKMLGRVRRGGELDIEAQFRRVWLLVDLLELYFVFRNKHFLGPKQSFLYLEEHDPVAHKAFRAALAPDAGMASFSALETLVSIVLGEPYGSGEEEPA